MRRRLFQTILTIITLVCLGAAQTAPVPAMRDNTPTVHALTKARIVVAPGNVIPSGTIVLRDGVIEAVGANVQPPADARVWNCEGMTVYAALIDLSSGYGTSGTPEFAPGVSTSISAPTSTPEKVAGATHWNTKVRADYDIAAEFIPDPKVAEKLRAQGFGLVLSTPQRGIFRGASALVSTADGPASGLVVRRNVAQTVKLEEGGDYSSGYPNSLMGVIAMIRQTWLDADWYRKAQESLQNDPAQARPETNNSLASLADAARGKQPVVIEATSDLNFFRAVKIGKEFNLKMLIRGSGEEYRRLDAVKATGVPVIVPLNFPEPPPVETPEDAMNVSLEELRHWDAAPENAGRLEKAGVPIALTASQLKDPSTFLAQVRKAIERGLSADAALAALTIRPAQWLGIQSAYGTLEKGKAASLLIADGDLFGAKTKIRELWVDGKRYQTSTVPAADLRGKWKIVQTPASGTTDTLSLTGEIDKLTGTLTLAGKSYRLSSVSFDGNRLALISLADSTGVVRLSASAGPTAISGTGELPDGKSFEWTGTRISPPVPTPDTATAARPAMALFPDVFPPGEFGRARQPEQPQEVLVRNATVWTQGKDGKLLNADLLVRSGKIVKVGKNLSASSGAVVIDATGKEITPGIIDSHSHTAAGSINEGGQAVTCETRIEDVLDPDDIWIYRQLAGGTTMANVLHGSANPIGGLNSIVKWRWGLLPNDMILAGAPPGVKFALGENVKQSNFQIPGRAPRYPQTRMGVEQLIRDRFKAALDYEKEWKTWEADKAKIPPRRDLELDALLEIVKGKRAIIAHAYRQDEMLMLIRLAEEFGIRVQSFEHVLEGYKIADVMAKAGVAGSTFSDWWAYKMEAFDAIPGNGAIMHDQGVVVSYNSDDSQLATRLNWEAGKALKFGIPEQEALAFVTSNPAKFLHIDDRVGSLEPGKDADFVLWSGNPLSDRTVCEQTWVDGRKYFDRTEDASLRATVARERTALIQRILSTKKEPATPGAMPGRPVRRPNELSRISILEVDHD